MNHLQKFLFILTLSALALGNALHAQSMEDLFTEEETNSTLTLPEVDDQPQPVRQNAPSVPANIRSLSGIARVAFIIDINGDVINPRIHSSSDERFEGPTLDAVGSWKFRPARKDGEPVAVRVILPMRFSGR